MLTAKKLLPDSNIEKYYKQKHQVNGYLQIMGLSFKTLSKALQDSNIGKKPLEIINDRILLEAKQLLLHTSLPIHDVAKIMGFNQDSSFVKFFQNLEGLSLNEFRALHQISFHSLNVPFRASTMALWGNKFP